MGFCPFCSLISLFSDLIRFHTSYFILHTSYFVLIHTRVTIENLIQAFAAQAACSLENLQMFRHIHKLQQYANSVTPTSNSIAMTVNHHGHVLHSSTNPLYGE
jgi:hypothetical protein